MSDGSVDIAIIDINGMIDRLPARQSRPTIVRVDSHLRDGGCKNVYEPELVSIGPYHRKTSTTENMTHVKYRYLKQLLDRRNEKTVDRYVTAMEGMEKEARKCYAKPLDLDETAFVRLMVLDGLFITELFRCYGFKSLRDKDDPIFKHERILSQLRIDILLLENQLPFFVLNQLFNMTKMQECPEENLIALALCFVDGMFFNVSVPEILEKFPLKNFDHLCGLIHDAWCLPFAKSISPHSYASTSNNETIKWDNIKSASDLRDAGIKLRKAKGNNNLMDIKFMNGVLQIPQLSVFDETESQLRNLIAYEQYLADWEPRYISDYAFFMHCLINSSDDVELLRCHGILENCLGRDEEVCSMFNRLGRNVLTSSSFCYSLVFCSVNKHCRRRVKRWKANLRHNYFHSPWSILSFLAAVALLLLTFTQTTYTVLTYYNRSRR